MQLYPALRASMGTWTYYIVKMRMREVATEVQFGSQVHNDFTLDEAIQRTINESRVKKGIVTYLTGRADHFFASLVVAAIGGAPKFFPVRMADDPQYELFKDEEGLDQSFGVLRFSGTQDYYALDGQHRLKAIKTLLQPQDEADRVEPPDGFADEEISVLMVIRPSDAREDEWLKSYRRLFSSLNRYAKPTDRDTNIIMDEDDAFAILTRRLIAEHGFFKTDDRHLESLKIQTKGRPLRERASHFTSLQQLYDLNEILLSTPIRNNLGWGPQSLPDELIQDRNKFKGFCPPEPYLDDLFDELVLYWDAIIAAIPDLQLDPRDAKNHAADGSDDQVADNTLFWPIGQEVMVRVVRAMLDGCLASSNNPTPHELGDVLDPLGRVNWNLHAVPWRGLLLVSVLDRRRQARKWTMRSEDRKEATSTAIRVLRWLVGLSELSMQEEERLKNEWLDLLRLPPTESHDDLWEDVAAMRSRILQ